MSPAVAHALDEPLHERLVLRVGRADEEVVRRARSLASCRKRPTPGRRTPSARAPPRSLRDLLAVLVGAGQEEDVLAALAHVAARASAARSCTRARGAGRVDVVDGRRDVEAHARMVPAGSMCWRRLWGWDEETIAPFVPCNWTPTAPGAAVTLRRVVDQALVQPRRGSPRSAAISDAGGHRGRSRAAGPARRQLDLDRPPAGRGAPAARTSVTSPGRCRGTAWQLGDRAARPPARRASSARGRRRRGGRAAGRRASAASAAGATAPRTRRAGAPSRRPHRAGH